MTSTVLSVILFIALIYIFGESMLSFVRVPDAITSRYVSWKSDTLFGRKGWLTRATEAEEYYYNDVDATGTTYTSTQKAKIQEATNIPVSINFLYPVCNQKLAILTQTRPSSRVVSTDGRAKQEAQILDKIKHGILYQSNSQLENESMMKDMLVAGMGGTMVIPSDYYRPGLFNLSVAHVPYDEFILDINAKKRNLEDMEGFFIEKAFTIPKVMKLYGDIISNLRDKAGNPVDIKSFTGATWVEGELTEKADITTTNWNADDRIIVREYYEKVYTTMFAVPNSETGLTDYMFAEDLDEDQQSLLASATAQYPDVFIKKSLILGDYLVWTEMLPITEYPLKVAFFEWGGRPYRSYGMIHYTQGMQQAYDKILSIMILNGILSNNAGWRAPKGAIPEEDRQKWEDFANNPRVIKEYVPRIIDNQVLVPERDEIQQLSNFYPQVLDMLKGGIEYSTGITSILQGDAAATGVEVFSSLQQYQNAAMMRIQLATQHVNETMRQLGQTLTEYVAATIKPDSYQFFDDKGDLNELKIAKRFINNMRQYRYQMVSVPSTAMPTQRLAVGTELMKIAQSSPDPAERQLLTQKAMELSDIREFEDLQEKLDSVKNAQSKLKDLQMAYNRLMETSKQMENKFINISLENRILKELAGREQQIGEKFAELETKLDIADQIANKKIKAVQEPETTK